MKRYFLIGLVVLATVSVMAQEQANDSTKKVSPWKCNGIMGLNTAATGLMNWSAGGKNNVSGVVFAKVRLLYSGKISWDSNLDVEYGISWIDQTYDKLQKTSDHLKFDTKLGWEFRKEWLLSISAAFETQMGYGYEYTGDATPNKLISCVLAPSYTDINLGLDWKPNDIFSIYLSPIGGRITTAYISDRDSARLSEQCGYDVRFALREKIGTWHYAKETNDKVYTNMRAELGINFKGTINYQYQDLKVMTTLTLFTPYAWDKTKMYLYTVGESATYTESQMEKLISEQGYDRTMFEFQGFRDNNRRFGNFDVDWTVSLSYAFLKCLNVTLSANLKYVNGLKITKFDKDGNLESATERIQLQGIIGVGVGYSF